MFFPVKDSDYLVSVLLGVLALKVVALGWHYIYFESLQVRIRLLGSLMLMTVHLENLSYVIRKGLFSNVLSEHF